MVHRAGGDIVHDGSRVEAVAADDDGLVMDEQEPGRGGELEEERKISARPLPSSGVETRAVGVRSLEEESAAPEKDAIAREAGQDAAGCCGVGKGGIGKRGER